MDVAIRWLIRRDMPEVLAIEKASVATPWVDDDFLCALRQRNCIGMVAEHGHQIVGFMIYELHKSRLHVLNFAVAADCRRMYVGQQMIDRLKDKLHQQRRNEIRLELREGNLTGQLFFRAMGFKAFAVEHGFYEDTGETAYLMRFDLNDEVAWRPKCKAGNRISAYLEADQ